MRFGMRRSVRSGVRSAMRTLVAAVALVCPGAVSGADHRLEVGGGTVDLSITGTAAVSEQELLHWTENAARAVTAYFGRYPVPRVRLYVRAGGGGEVGHGVTRGGPLPSIRIDVGRDAQQSDLQDDWVLTHEMVHLAFPDLTTDDRWAEEGLATYVEPLARARIGMLRGDDVWAGLLDGLPKGLSRGHGGGLHGTEEWGRTYWGGALCARRRPHT